MFSGISWAQYALAAGVLTAIYYGAIALRYFSGDIKDLLSGKRKFVPSLQAKAPDSSPAALPLENSNLQVDVATEEDDPFGDFDQIEALIGELKTTISEAAERQLDTSGLKQELATVLRAYPGLKGSPVRPSINELVASECEKYGAAALGESEVELLWEDS